MAFCPGHSNCEAPISVITNILTKDPSKFEEISNEFKSLEFNTVKDLANSSFGKIGKINSLGEDPLAKLYEALETYAEFCANQLESAKLEYNQKNYEKTQVICKEMLLHKPHDLEFLVLLASSYYDCKEYDTSMTYLKEAYNKYPNCVELLNNLGICYYSKSQFVEAFECFKNALCKDMSCADAWINSAKVLKLANKTQEALSAFKMALCFNPNSHNIRIEFAQLLTSLNRTKEAEEQYKIVTIKAPEYVDGWNNIGCFYMFTDKIKNAIFCYEKSLELNNTLTKTWYYLGIAFLKIEQYQNAMNSFQKALILCPDDIIILKYLAQVYFHQKNWPLAIDTYKQVLKFYPDDLYSNLNLGLIYDKFQKNYQEAVKYFKIILNLNPHNEEFHRHLIELYKKLGNNKCVYEAAISFGDMFSDQEDYEHAKIAYNYALKFDQFNGIGHWKLGNAMYRLGHIDSAFARYKICLELKPNFANAYSDCGLICEEKNHLEKALDYYEAAHALDPNNLNVLLNLASLKEKQGKLEDVIELNYKILSHDDSDNFLVHLDLARFQKKIGNIVDALKNCGLAMKYVLTNSELMDVSVLLGSLLIDMKKKEEALVFFSRVSELNPQCAISHTNMGSIYKDFDNFIEAIHSYNNALNIIPNFPDAYCNLVQCFQHICDWSDYDNRILKLKEIVAKQISNDQVPSILPHHSLLYNFSPEMLKNIAMKFANQCIDKANLVKKRSFDYVNQTCLSNGRIRVGYVSSDFGDHPITQLMQSIPNFHDRNKVEVFCYSLSPNDGSLSWSKISTESDHFKDISELNVFDAANLINNDGIHILVNMNGYTKGARNEIFAMRPAPIQVLWLGYPSTTGASFIDYLITDKVCSPPELEHFYTEKLAYLNQSVFIGDHKQSYKDLKFRSYQNKLTEENKSLTNGNIHDKDNFSNELVPINNTNLSCSSQSLSNDNLKCFIRQMYNLPEDVIVYCNFSQLFKIDPSTFRLWAEILHHVPNSVLWLLQFPSSGEQNLKKYAETLNIDPSRIIFSSVEKKEEHMQRIQLADVFLDTPLCNAHTTCLDVLWAGMPVITLPGKTLASRVAASQLTTLGCTDTIAENEEDYVKKAIQLGSDRTLLESLRSKIWSLKTESKLFDCKSYTEELETIYQHMWRNFLSNHDLNMQL